ncbi:MAG: head GIN domain-containing protein [Bacteroidia bacterium]
MRTPLKFILLSPVLFSMNSCHIICTEGKGPMKSEQRNPGEFSEISLDIPADLKVIKGDDFSVNIEAEENLLEKIKTKIRSHALNIDSERCLDPGQRIKITVALPELEELEVNGSGNITMPDTFQVKDIKLEIKGSGDINAKLVAAKIKSSIMGSGNIILQGSANEHETSIMGSGDVKAGQLPCNSSEIDVNGSGDVHVYVIQNLDVQINGSGSVHYKGKPSVSTHINGSGKVVDEN